MARAHNKQEWESAEFPILCESCLGPNPLVRMLKQAHGDECNICNRPFTVFRWLPGPNARYKRTEICQTCARLKNVCQTCILDLEYGLPVQVRDAALKTAGNLPQGDVNRQYFVQNVDLAIQKGAAQSVLPDYKNAGDVAGRALLQKLARTTPYYDRNRSHLCSFYAKGNCTRGATCPYRHELPTEHELASKHNLRDRYYGEDDPVAERVLKRAARLQSKPPSDPTITSIYVTGVTEAVTADLLKDYFYAFGEIRDIFMVRKQMAAFVHYTTREAAERVMEKCSLSGVVLAGAVLSLAWGRPRQNAFPSSSSSVDASQSKELPLPGTAPIRFASQDPLQLGSIAKK